MEAGFVVALANPSQVDGVWEKVVDGLQRALDNTGNDISAHTLWAECRAGTSFLVVVSSGDQIKGASVWRFETWDHEVVFRCLSWYGEDVDKWLADHRKVSEQMARAGQADSIVAEGRKGLQAMFPEAKVLRYLYKVELYGR